MPRETYEDLHIFDACKLLAKASRIRAKRDSANQFPNETALVALIKVSGEGDRMALMVAYHFVRQIKYDDDPQSVLDRAFRSAQASAFTIQPETVVDPYYPTQLPVWHPGYRPKEKADEQT